MINLLMPKVNDLFVATVEGIFVSRSGSDRTAISTGVVIKDTTAIVAIDSALFAATADGMFRSIDDGPNWTAANDGLSNKNVSDLVVSGSNIFAGTLGRIFVTNNNGANWTLIRTTGMSGKDGQALIVL
jgi:photosystem II stability/assembly factor-like uncharacterized protein